MINILDCKNLNYLDKLKAILNKRRFARKINTNIASQIVNEIKKFSHFKNLNKVKKIIIIYIYNQVSLLTVYYVDLSYIF